MDIGVARRGAPLAAPGHGTPDDLLRRIGNVRRLVHDRGVHPAEFEQNGREVFRSCLRDDFADKGAAGEENEVKRKLQEFCVLFLAASYHGYGRRIEIFRDKVEQHLGRFRECFAQRENTGVSRRERRQRRTDQQEQGSVERADDERHAVGLAIDHALVAGFGKEAWHGCFHGLHPLFELALLDLALATRCRSLEDVFLRCGLELLRHRLLEALLVLPDHAGHAVELVDAPFIGTRDARGEQRLLCVEYFLKLIHLEPPPDDRIVLKFPTLEGSTPRAAVPERLTYPVLRRNFPTKRSP